jgi:hypothetical protein
VRLTVSTDTASAGVVDTARPVLSKTAGVTEVVLGDVPSGAYTVELEEGTVSFALDRV